MESDGPKKHKADDLEVTGVSRSGRVRKKSSKLMDFESPDDIETRPKRPAQAHHQRSHPTPMPPPQMSPQVNSNPKEELNDELSEEDFYDPTLENPNDSMESDSDEGGPLEEAQMDNSNSGSSHSVSRPGNSIYMMEKSNKKKLLVKDGKIVGRAKAQRKDKGKTRVTAYMMWAKTARNELIKNHPEMDFSAISKRLGEMWANVNFLERYLWKRRAKRFAASKSAEAGNKVNSKPLSASTPKVTNSSHNNSHNIQTPATGQHSSSHSSRIRQSAHSKQNHNTSGGSGSGTVNNSGGSSSGSGSGMYRVVGVGPVEVGAHLRLLGESLTIIGERLKEHEGQIAVSGSVSVLLDTLLCSLAPLVCLTAHIPSIAPPVPLLQETLDNIAYIMPGL